MNKYQIFFSILTLFFTTTNVRAEESIPHDLHIIIATDNAMISLHTNSTFNITPHSLKGFMIIEFPPNEVAIFEKGELRNYISLNTEANSHKDRVTISNAATSRVESSFIKTHGPLTTQTYGFNLYSKTLNRSHGEILKLDGNPIAIKYRKNLNSWSINYEYQDKH